MMPGLLNLLLIPAAPLLLIAGAVFAPLRRCLMATLPLAALPALVAAVMAPDRVVSVDWLLLGAQLGVDSIGRVFLLFTGLLWLVAGWHANAYIREPGPRVSYAVFHLLAMSGNLGLIIAQDMASFYLFFALMGFASYGLVVHQRDEEAMRAGRVYMVLVVVGEVLLFAGLQRLHAATGGLPLPRMSVEAGYLTILLLLVGFGIKAGALPLHVWLPLAHPAAPVPASAVLSGAMIKAGLLGWLRFVPTAAPGAEAWGGAIIWFGFAAAFYGAVVGFCQTDAKCVLAYSSISQMGLLTAGFGLCFLPGCDREAVTTMICVCAAHHGLAKGALFLSVGIMAHPPRIPRALYYAALLLPALSLTGAPWTSGASAKDVLKSAGAAVGGWKTALALGSVGTGLLMLRFLLLGARLRRHAPAGPGQWLPWLTLTALVAGFPFAVPSAEQAGLGATLWPMLVAGVIAFVFLPRLSDERPIIPPGDVLAWVALVIGVVNRVRKRAGRRFRSVRVSFCWWLRGMCRRVSRRWLSDAGDEVFSWRRSVAILLVFIVLCAAMAGR